MTGHQLRVARAHLNWSLDDLAKRLEPEVSRRTIVHFEQEEREPRQATIEAVERVFTAAGIKFSTDGFNVTFRPEGKDRR